MNTSLLGILLVLVSVSVEALGHVALKKSAVISGHTAAHRIYAAVGIGLFAIEAIVWTAVLSVLDLSIAFPLGSLSFVTTAIFSFLLLGEKIAWQRWAGILTIVCGTAFLSMS